MIKFAKYLLNMKHKGCKFEYQEDRDNDLMRAYREQMAACEVIVLSEIFEKVVQMPTKRFWVSEERAYTVIKAMMRGKGLHGMRTTTREMYTEIYKRVCRMRASTPEKPIAQIVFAVIRQPAPQFYLTPGSARVIVTKIKSKHLEKAKKRLRHMFNML